MNHGRMEDYGKDTFKEIGKLSSMLPAYIRHCCRAMHDGTDLDVLDAYREVAYKVLLNYTEKYKFVNNHLELLRIYTPEMMQNLIKCNQGESRRIGLQCLSTSTAIGLPKRACLHCPKVSTWVKVMQKAGTIDETTGERKDYK